MRRVKQSCDGVSPPLFLLEMILVETINEQKGARSKYNVGSDIEKRTHDGIVFDSVMEMKFYRDVVLPQVRSGDITSFELQKSYVLQPKFNNGNKIVQPIYYVADFYLEYADGHSEVIDTKGCADSVAKIKRKMFWFQHPEITYRWITYAKKYGGWADWDYVAKERRAAKRLKELQKKEQEANQK